MRAADPLPQLAAILALAATLLGCTIWSPERRNNEAVRFSLYQPDAREVHFCSSLDGFIRHPASSAGQGVWASEVRVDREISYFFVVDGRAMLPECAMTVDDDFGSKNCIYVPGL